jgi:hypothetical protein
LTNSAYTGTISDIHIWVIRKIVELLETRILCYEDIARQFEKTKKTAVIPPWFSETIGEYWDIAGLPHEVSGTFFYPGLSLAVQVPTVPTMLTFVKDEGGQNFGWYFSIGKNDENDAISLFLDPQKSAKTIYARAGKTPAQRTIQLDCTLYANPAMGGDVERDIVERRIKPFARADREGIDVRIIFDGNTFEIWEYPAAHANTLIFRGRRVP